MQILELAICVFVAGGILSILPFMLLFAIALICRVLWED